MQEAENNILAAPERWGAALAFYAKIPEPKSVGCAHLRLARRAANPKEAAEHREAARAAWDSIDRQDLIEKYLGKGA